jgi:hypothetical protein
MGGRKGLATSARRPLLRLPRASHVAKRPPLFARVDGWSSVVGALRGFAPGDSLVSGEEGSCHSASHPPFLAFLPCVSRQRAKRSRARSSPIAPHRTGPKRRRPVRCARRRGRLADRSRRGPNQNPLITGSPTWGSDASRRLPRAVQELRLRVPRPWELHGVRRSVPLLIARSA